MILDDAVHALREKVQAFLDDRHASGLVLRYGPANEQIAGRLLGNWDADRLVPRTIALPIGVGFSHADQFYAEAQTFLTEYMGSFALPGAPWHEDEGAIEQLLHPPSRSDRPRTEMPRRRETAGDEQAFFAIVDGPRETSDNPDLRFAEYLEGLTRTLLRVVESVMFVIHFAHVDNRDEAQLTISRLASALAMVEAKLVVLDSLEAPLFTELAASSHRFQSVDIETHQSKPDELVQSLIAHPATRVTQMTPTPGARQVANKARSGAQRRGIHIVEVANEFRGRAHYCQAVYHAAAQTLCQGIPAGMPPNIYDTRTGTLPEASLTEHLEALQPREPLLLLLDPPSLTDDQDWRDFIQNLSSQAVSTDVRYIILGPEKADLSPQARPPVNAAQSPTPFTVVNLRLGISDIEHGIRVALQKPSLDIDLKGKLLAMLGIITITSGSPTEGKELLAESVELAEGGDSPQDKATAWLNLAMGLQRQKDWELAKGAFVKAGDYATEARNSLVACHAYLGLGDALFMEEAYEDAMQSYETARICAVADDMRVNECHALMWMGEACRRLSQFDEAETLLQMVVERWEGAPVPLEDLANSGLAEANARLASLYQAQSRDEEAERHRELAKALGLEQAHENPA